jgi:predicted unusual protein kinase regulating ubiquinone biosynthesis (AarF/ABC1/UbiB family)
MGQLVKGGGLGKGGLSIVGITTELESVARNYQLCIPPYFALVLRAFSVIEGIALKVRSCVCGWVWCDCVRACICVISVSKMA